jgi:Fibronectin type III domain
MIYCDGTNATIVSSRQCTIPFTVLTASPYFYIFGDNVFVKIVAINSYGESISSDDASGAIILQVPSAPVRLTNSNVTNTSSSINLRWMNGLGSGGTPIIDYRVSYDQSTGNYVTLASGILTLSYNTSISLTPGSTYKFRVEARNSVGYSALSSELSILWAQPPG